MSKITGKEQQFLMELADLLKRYGLTIEQRTSYDSFHHSEDWSFEGNEFDLDICDVADWLTGKDVEMPTVEE